LGALAGLPSAAVTTLVASAIDLIVHLARRPDGGRAVAEIAGLRRAGDELVVEPLWAAGRSGDVVGFAPVGTREPG
jgi:pilus assembly protein CpaF